MRYNKPKSSTRYRKAASTDGSKAQPTLTLTNSAIGLQIACYDETVISHLATGTLAMDRKVVSEELSRFFGVLAHPLRVLIVEELRNGELTVTDLKDALKVPQASVSQHLGILRANRIVLERREGRHVFYHLRQPELANIVVQCIPFVAPDKTESKRIITALDSAKSTWTQSSGKNAKRTRS